MCLNFKDGISSLEMTNNKHKAKIIPSLQEKEKFFIYSFFKSRVVISTENKPDILLYKRKNDADNFRAIYRE